MKRATWTILLLLLGAVVCASAVPPIDVPETSYNEADRPLSQAHSVAGIRLVRPVAAPVIAPAVPPRNIVETKVCSTELTWKSLRVCSSSHSLQELLCILII